LHYDGSASGGAGVFELDRVSEEGIATQRSLIASHPEAHPDLPEGKATSAQPSPDENSDYNRNGC
jgi:hypothetical protein